MTGIGSFWLLSLFFFQSSCYMLFSKGKIFDNLERILNVSPALLASNVKEKWFTQKLNHENDSDNRTWQQRYFINSQYFTSSNGPIFLMLGAEGEAYPAWLLGGTWALYAVKFKALLIYLEHRYYGQSRPLPNITTESLRYLSASQAISDAANFVGTMKRNYTNNRWIAFGGSYGGNLVAWLRLKFPNLVQGGVSSSAPVLVKTDFREFYRVTAQSLGTYSSYCVSAISDAYIQLGALLKTEDGKKRLSEMFNVCIPLEQSTDYNDIRLFQQGLADNFAAAVQANKINPNSNYSINSLCSIMVDTKLGAPINRLAATNRYALNNFKSRCLDCSYRNLIRFLQDTKWSLPSAVGRQWFYQTCSEFGYYSTSSAKPHVFGNGFPVEFYIQQCTDTFGASFNAKFVNDMVDRTNLIFGGLNISETVTNVAFVQGSIDPWHALGITKTRNIKSPAFYIRGVAHCADMVYTRNLSNPPQLTAAVKSIEAYINYWLTTRI